MIFDHGTASSLSNGFPSEMVVNGRFRLQRITGVQRYAHELVSRIAPEVEVLVPQSGKGAAGHLWEQMALPLKAKGRLLWNPNASGPLAYRRQVVTFHDLFPVEHPEWYSAAYAKWYGLAMRRLAARAVHLIAVSEYTKSRLVNVFERSPDDITVVHNGCHIKQRASVDKVAEAADALRLPSRHYLLSLSSLEQRKNLRVLLEAWSILHQHLPKDVWLVLAGSPVDVSIYGKQFEYDHLPRVFFTGYVPEEHLAGLYSGASLFVFPSLAEGFGLPLLEAMACGVRCIASGTSSMPEVGGQAVHYINPKSPAELVSAISLRFKRGQQDVAYEPSLHQASLFTWDGAFHKTQRVLESSCLKSAAVAAGIVPEEVTL